MVKASIPNSRQLPQAVKIVGSLFVVFHLFSLLILAIAAPSGPWPSPFGISTAISPPFAETIANFTTRSYLQPLHMNYNYHYMTNRPDFPGVYFVAKVRNAEGDVIETVRLPDPKANRWVRLRQEIIAQGLADDEPVQPPQGEGIPAKGKEGERITFWDSLPGDNKLFLKSERTFLLPKNRPISKPREWSLILARSYARHLARKYDGRTVELVRFSRQPVMPALLFLPEPPAGTFDMLESRFEDYEREK